MKMKKALVALVCAIALVTATFLGTMAYFTSQDSVTNTFTVGKVEITLDETNVDKENDSEPERDKENEYHLIPGVSHVKDPMVTVVSGSEDCYVRMLVEVENIDHLKDALKDSKYYAGDVFLIQMLTGNETTPMTWDEVNWPHYAAGYKTGTKTVDGKTISTATYEFRYKEKVEKGTMTNGMPKLFTNIMVPGADAGNDDMATLADVKINVTAHAIQADGFADANAAWAAWN